MKPDSFEDISAVLALYRPGPMGANAHNNYARPQERQAGRSTPIHPELAEPLEEILGETYGLIVYQEQVMEIAAEARRATPLARPTCCAARWARRRRRSWRQQYEGFRDGMVAQRLLRARGQDAVGHPAPVLRLRASTSPTRPATGWCPTGRRTSRPTSRPSTWPPCSPACATTRTSRRSTSTSAAGWASRCCRPTSTSPTPTSRRSGTDIRFGLSAIRNVGTNVVAGLVGAREADGRFTDFNDFMDKVPAVVCNKRVLESLCKAGRVRLPRLHAAGARRRSTRRPPTTTST